MVINILDHVEHCYSNDDGKVIFQIINNALKNGEQVTVSFNGITSLNSSFVNSAFIELLDHCDFSLIQEKLRFINSTQQINRMIKRRFSFEINRKELAFA